MLNRIKPHLNEVSGNLNDEELMILVCNGEVKAFDELYYRYAKNLMGYFMRMLNFDKELCKDALQDIFMKIAENPEKFDGSKSFKTWIFCIASNHCKNIYRHDEVVAKSHQEIRYLEQDNFDYSFQKYISTIDGKEFKRALDNLLNELSPDRKECFILRYQEDKTISEIAQIQKCPEGSVKSRLHYTLKLLENKLLIFNPKSQS